jgi:hypothetical protein
LEETLLQKRPFIHTELENNKGTFLRS